MESTRLINTLQFVASTRAKQLAESESLFLPMHLVYRIVIIASFCLLLILAVSNVKLSSRSPAFIMLCLALIVNFAVQLLPIVFYKPSYGWFHPLVFVVCKSLVGQFRSISSYTYGIQNHFALPGWGAEDLTLIIAYALALGSIGFISFYLGYFMGATPRVPRVKFRRPRYLTRKIILIIGFSMLVFAIYMQTRGGVMGHLFSFQTGRHKEMSGKGYWNICIQLSAIACLVWFALDRRALLKPLFWVCSIASLFVDYVNTGSRGDIIYFITMGLLVWMLREKKFAPTRIMILAILGLFIIGFLGALREGTLKGDTSLNFTDAPLTTFISGGAEEAANRAWATSGLIPILALVPDKVAMLYGESYLALLVLPVPRSMWKEKPGQTGGRVGRTFFRTNAGTPPGPIGEAYWNFHIPGVILAFFLYGIFHRWLAKFYLKYSGQPAAIVIYVTVLFVCEASTIGIIAIVLLLVPVIVILRLTGAISFR